MPLPHPLPEELIALIVRRFHLLGEPMRLRLLDRLRDGEATVHELADELGLAALIDDLAARPVALDPQHTE